MDVKLNSKNQITLPKQVREHLHLKPGDCLKFFLQPDGVVVILPTIPVSRLKGTLPKQERPISVEEVNRAIDLRS